MISVPFLVGVAGLASEPWLDVASDRSDWQAETGMAADQLARKGRQSNARQCFASLGMGRCGRCAGNATIGADTRSMAGNAWHRVARNGEARTRRQRTLGDAWDDRDWRKWCGLAGSDGPPGKRRMAWFGRSRTSRRCPAMLSWHGDAGVACLCGQGAQASRCNGGVPRYGTTPQAALVLQRTEAYRPAGVERMALGLGTGMLGSAGSDCLRYESAVWQAWRCLGRLDGGAWQARLGVACHVGAGAGSNDVIVPSGNAGVVPMASICTARAGSALPGLAGEATPVWCGIDWTGNAGDATCASFGPGWLAWESNVRLDWIGLDVAAGTALLRWSGSAWSGTAGSASRGPTNMETTGRRGNAL